jgi:PPM family protein phosphatase
VVSAPGPTVAVGTPADAAPSEPTPSDAAPAEAAPAAPEAAPVAAEEAPSSSTASSSTAAPAGAEAAAPSPAPETAAPAQSEPPPSDGNPTQPHAVAKVESLVEKTTEIVEGIGARYFGRTDVGLVREHNEDNFLVADFTAERRGIGSAILETKVGPRGCVFAVCDGMGGAAAGEVASQMAVDTVFEVMESGGAPRDRDGFARRLVHAIEEAGSRIFAAAKMDRTRRGMGTTSTVAGLVDNTLFVGQVGDSRAYVLRGDQFALITKDQSLVNQLIEAGQLTEEEAEAFEHSNIILQALGTTEEVTVDLTFLELRRGDRLLLCSDGLSGLVHADMMKEVLQGSRDLVDAAQQLIGMANAGGGHDNITVVLVDFDGTELKHADDSARVAYQQYPLPPPPPEDDEPKATRTPSMKAGGPKPGADVKKSLPSPPRSVRPKAAAAAKDDGGGSPLVWLGVTAIIILILAAVAYALSGAGGAPAADERRTSGGASPTVAPVRESTVTVVTDLTGGELWVNGVRHSPLRDGASLTLAPNTYHFEARDGAAEVAEATVTLGAGEHRDVELRMPLLPDEPGAAPSVEIGRSELTPPPTGVEPTTVVVEGGEPSGGEPEGAAEAPTGAAVPGAPTE